MPDPDAALHQAVPGKYKPAGIPAPAPYAPRQTGTLADVVERGPDLGGGLRPAGPDGFAPAPGFGELIHAGRVQSRAYRTDFDEIMLRDGYSPIVDALGLDSSENPARYYSLDPQAEARFGTLGQPSSLATAARRGETVMGTTYLASRDLQETLIAEQIRARRAKEKDFLPGVPDTVDGLHQYFREQEARKRHAASATIARSTGLGDALTVFAGGGIETFHDPFNIATLPIGGGGKSLLQTVGRETVVNGLIEALQLPVAAHNLDELGEHLTAGEAVTDVATAGVFGGLLGGTFHVAGEHIPPLLFKAMPDSVQARWANRMKVGEGKDAPLLKDVLGDMDNRELAGFARSTIGGRMTPDEKAATSVLEREQELGEASPFMAGPSGDAAHQAGLADTLKAIIDGVPREAPARAALLSSSSPIAAPPLRPFAPGAASVPHDIVDFFKSKGLDDARAYGIAAGIMAESGGDHTVVNPKSGASFLGQWLGSRLDAVKARYGPNPSRAQQLEFLWHELTGGDPGGKYVLEAKDPGAVLDAYIRKFMRPAAGAETLGDLKRGMAALGGGELPEGGAAVAGGDDELMAGLRRDADQAVQEALTASADRGGEDAELGRARKPDAADFPIFKRELFGSDGDWFDAQLGFYRSQGLIGDAAEAPANAASAAAGDAGGGVPGPEGGGSAQRAPGEAGGANADLTVPAYVDAYLRGEGRGDSPRDRELLQFAANNGPAIEEEFKRRAAQPLTMSELENIGRPVNAKLDPLWYAGLNAVHETELGKEPAALWALRDKGSGEVVSWGVKRKAVEGEKAKFWEPEQLEIERLHPETVAAELRERASLQAAEQAVQDIRIDEPALEAFDDGAGGRVDQVESLEHDLRMDVADRNAAAAAEVLASLQSSGRLPRSPMSLLEFIAAKGGIEDPGGDLKSMGLAARRGRAERGQRKLLLRAGDQSAQLPGMKGATSKNSPERLFEAAIAADYFPELNRSTFDGGKYQDKADLADFYAAIDEELRGRPRYSAVDQDALFERARHEEGNAELAHHIDNLQATADEWGVALDEGSFGHALDAIARGTAPDLALEDAIQAAAMRDLATAVADTGELRYGVDNSGRRWDDEVNYAEHRDPAADDRAARPGERRPADQAADAAPGGAVAGEPEGAAGQTGLDERRYQLAEGREPQTLAEILAELDAERDAAAALRACAEPGK